jgi:kynurenine formamidase
MAREEFDALLKQVDNAGRWGDADERGTLNLITPEVRRSAASEVKAGVTVSLEREMVDGEPKGTPRPVSVRILVVSDSVLGPSDGSVTWAVEMTSEMSHTEGLTHIDGLTHLAYRGRGYNNVPAAHAPPVGQLRNAVGTMRDGIVTRGVLIDLPRLKGVPYVAPGGAITADDFEAWERRSGMRVRAGDVLLVRSGRWSQPAIEAKVAGSAGIHPSAAAWLHARGVAAIGDEGGTDTRPTAVAGINAPLHVLALVGMGMPIMEGLDLERLASEAADRKRWTFLLVVAPLDVRGATGSAINPVAIF